MRTGRPWSSFGENRWCAEFAAQIGAGGRRGKVAARTRPPARPALQFARAAPHGRGRGERCRRPLTPANICGRSEEHTSELQSREKLVCRLLLEKKKTR